MKLVQSKNDYDFPLDGSKKFNLIGANLLPVKFSCRTREDFDNPDKLSLKNPPISRSKYELYQQALSKDIRSKTRGRFENDPDRIEVVKLPA